MEEDFVTASLTSQFLAFPEVEKESASKYFRFPESCYNSLPSILSLTSTGHKLEGLQSIFSRCVSLRKLDVDGCNLSPLTDEILHLSKLVNLHLKRCNISTFHEAFAGKFQVVRYLEVSFSQLVRIPSDINLCGQLEDIILNDNCIEFIPESLYELGKLKALILTGNRISDLSENVAKLQTLMVLMMSHNCISVVPVTIAYLTKLKHLQVSSNHCHPDTSPYKFRSISSFQRELSTTTIQYPPSEIVNSEWRVLHKYCHVVCSVKATRLLDLQNLGVSKVGHDLVVFTTITAMNLKGNRLADLPTEVESMRSLTAINLSKNVLLQFPFAISNAKNLIELNVSNNNIVVVPAWISNLDALSMLDISANSLRTLPLEIAKCKSLSNIDMSPNLWEWLPQSIVDRGFVFLKTYYSNIMKSHSERKLDLKNMDLKKLSLQVFFESFRDVTQVDFSGNSLSEIIDEFSVLEKLKTILISSNKLTVIPNAFLSLKQLTALDVSFNCFVEISSNIEKLANLRFLSFKSNAITSIHPSISFSRQLVSLDLSCNQISKLHGVYFNEMFQLASLFLQNNQFETFPNQLFGATSLTELNLAANPFTILPNELITFKDVALTLDLHKITQPSQTICSQGLHAIFQWMSKLNLTSTSNSSTLDLTAYGLTALPPEFLVNDSNTITELILKANSIKKLPLDCFHALKKIQLLDYSMNELFDIPDVIFSLSCLEHLDLSCNSITFIPNTISLLKNLKLLNFVGNSIPSIPFQIGSLPKLNQLFLNINAIISPPPSITNLGDEFILSFLKLLHGCSAQGALLLPPLSIEGWLPEVFTILSNLTKLSVLSNSFFELDFDVCDFSNLLVFDGSFNKISSIKDLRLLTKLEHLNLSNNLLTNPGELFAAINLKTLLVSCNMISDFPGEILCILLEYLDMSSNPLSEITIKLLTCTKLKHFNISNSSVSVVPEVVYLMDSLTEMNLTGVILRTPPPEVILAGFEPIKKYSALMYHGRIEHSLNLSKMSLKSVPEEIYQLSHLTELNLDDNFFVGTFPKDLLNSLQNLQSLQIKGHKFTFPPKEIIDSGSVERMRRFYDDFEMGIHKQKLKLNHYFLVKMPPQANSMALTYLDLSDNLLSSLDISLRSDMISTLTKINLFANKFTEVPNVIFKLSRLTSLNLASNTIKDLKGNYHHLKNLQILNVSNNMLQTLDRSLIQLEALTSLEISGHRFAAFPDVLSGLQSLQNVTLNISNFTELRKLNVDQNVDFPPFNVVKGGMPKIIDLCKKFQDARFTNFMNLSGLGLPILMDEVMKYENLTDVDVSRNSILILKAEICNLTKISHLNLSYNRISILPSKISQLTILECLQCAHNNISHFSESLGAIDSLAELTLVGNPLESPSAMLAEKHFSVIKDYFEQLYKSRTTRNLNLRGKYIIEFHFEWEEQMQHMALQSIDLHNNMMTSIPPQIAAFCSHSLVELQLDYNQLGNSIWDVVKDLVLLTHFSSSHNTLSSVPDTVSALTCLKFLNLSFNRIRVMYQSFANLNRLSALYLQSNLLTEVPFSFDDFKNLAELNLSGNNLEDPCSCDRIHFSNAGQRLLLGNNLIRTISDIFCFQCCTIKGLNLSHNNISLLPDSISLLTRLSYLFLENNVLCLLPYSIGHLTGMKELNLQDNFLTILPSSLGLCTQLSSLNLYGNPLTMFPQTTKLWSLPLPMLFNYLDDFLITPTEFEGKKLLELRLSNKNLKHIPLNVMTTKEVIKYVQKESEKMITNRILARVSQGIESRSALSNHFGQGTLLSRNFLKVFSRAKNDTKRTEALEALKNEESLDMFGRPLDLVDRAIKTGGYLTLGIEKVAARYKDPGETLQADNEETLEESEADATIGRDTINSSTADDVEEDDMKYKKLSDAQKRKLDENIMLKISGQISEMALRQISGQMMSAKNANEQDTIGTLVYDFDILHLDHNEILTLPKIIYRLYNTSVMNLQFNFIDSISNEFKYLSSLTHLRLDTNRVSSISAEISRLTSLSILNLSRNMIQYDTLNSVSWDKMVALTNLDLSENSISCNHRFLPQQMYLIPKLQVFRLVKCYLRKNPDPDIGYLTQLRELDLSYNLFTELCFEFRHLRHCLKKLICEQTPVSFPDFDVISLSPAWTVCKLLHQMWLAKRNGMLFVQKAELLLLPMVVFNWETVDPLQFLVNSGTDDWDSELNLDVLKHQIKNSQKLRAAVILVMMANAEIREMLASPGFHLKQLNLVGNHIKVLPEEISRLRHLNDLNVSENELISVPSSIGSLVKLAYIDFSHNKLQALPDELSNNMSLIDFRCTHNELRYIPFKMGSLPILKWLDTSFNDMSFPPQTTVSLGPLSVVEFMKKCWLEFTESNSLSLTSRNIVMAPMGLFKIENLVAIDLSNNAIVTLPSQIDSASFLNSLNLCNNQLISIPASIGFLTELTYLYLKGNQMRALPPTLAKCKGLRLLDIRSNAFKTLPVFVLRAFEELENLWYSENDIRHIDVADPPPRLQRLKNLKSAKNQVSEFFKPFFFATTIIEMDFSGNSLSTIPEELHTLCNLINLNLSMNKLKRLSKNIGALTQLKQLFLQCNHIAELVPSFQELHSLQHLKLHENPLKKCPPELRCLTGLIRLTLSGCSMNKFDENIKGKFLTILTMSNNALVSLPVNVVEMSALRTLVFNSNAVVELPSTIHRMTSLTELRLSNNSISRLPETLFQMKQLVILALNGNNIAKLDMSIGGLANLEELYLENNVLYEMPDTIVSLQMLQVLNVAENALESLPHVRAAPFAVFHRAHWHGDAAADPVCRYSCSQI